MDSLATLVDRARSGDPAARLDAFGELVRRFQDMAYGYAYVLLGDFHLAEDAAQDAFVTAYGRLDQLREAAAFPGWLRRIVRTACRRFTRRTGRAAPLTAAEGAEARTPDPGSAAERAEIRDRVLAAIRALPEAQREVTALYYIDGYSQGDVAAFLEIPVSTVNNRLHDSRQRLKRRMMTMVADGMKSRPLSPEFPDRIRLLLELPRPLEIEGHPVQSLWEAFRACYADFEVVELPEVMPRAESLLTPGVQEGRVHAIDPDRMLRVDLTAQLVHRWLAEGGGPCRWITAGRVFRRERPDSRRLEVFHQAEVLWAEEGLDPGACEREMRRVAVVLTPDATFERGPALSYVPVSQAYSYGVSWQGDLLHNAAGGMFDRAWVERGGLDPERAGVLGFAFGLERTAMVRHGLDDVRALWRPPFVAA